MGEAGHAKFDGRVASSDRAVNLSEFVLGGGEADPEPFGFADPSFVVGFGDAGDEVGTDVD